MVCRMLWLARIHTKPEYTFPVHLSWNKRCERWAQSKKSIMDDSVSLSLTCLLTISMIRHFVKPVIEYFGKKLLLVASATVAISWTNCVPIAFCSGASLNLEH